MLRISDCVGDSVSIAIPQSTEWQRIGDQIDAAMIFAGTDFVNVLNFSHFLGLRGDSLAITATATPAKTVCKNKWSPRPGDSGISSIDQTAKRWSKRLPQGFR